MNKGIDIINNEDVSILYPCNGKGFSSFPTEWKYCPIYSICHLEPFLSAKLGGCKRELDNGKEGTAKSN